MTNPTPEYKAFKTIFGDKKRLPLVLVRDQVLLDFCVKFPDGKGTLPRGKDGSFTLSTYVESSGSRVSQEELDTNPMVDYEFFAIHMENTRRWKPEQILGEWQKLKKKSLGDEPEIKSDKGGPAHCPDRLGVPGSLMGTDMVLKRRSNFEEQRVDTSNKAQKNIAWEQRAALVEKTRFGLNVAKVDASKADMRSSASLSPNEKGPMNATELLMGAASNLQNMDLTSPESPQQTGQAQAPEVDPRLPKKKAIADIPVLRSNSVLWKSGGCWYRWIIMIWE